MLEQYPEDTDILIYMMEMGDVFGCVPEFEYQSYNNLLWISPGEICI